jgi:hypothetical protein
MMGEKIGDIFAFTKVTNSINFLSAEVDAATYC